MNYDIEDTLMGCLLGSIMLGFALLLAAAAVDAVQSARAFDGKMACTTRRMEPNRQSFTTRVVCTPINTRQDTSTVQVKVQP